MTSRRTRSRSRSLAAACSAACSAGSATVGRVRRRERERIMRQGVVLPGDAAGPSQPRGARGRRARQPAPGPRELALRLRNFRPDAGSYLASLGGPLPYMARLREIDALTIQHEQRLAEATRRSAATPTRGEGARRGGWDFGEVNELIERHNPLVSRESRLPMDPRTGDYALVNGRSYRRRPLDEAWVLERFPSPRA